MFLECEGDIEQVKHWITQLSEIKVDENTVYLSSTHRGKGDEALNIWIVQAEQYLPTKFSGVLLNDNQRKEEINLLYVALTRCCGTTLTIESSTGWDSIESITATIREYKELPTTKNE